MLVGETFSTQTCLACRRKDIGAGFLVTYSYCAKTDSCVQDEWNYINFPCASGWVRGKDLRLDDDCKAKTVTCLDFTSGPDKVQQYFNRTWTLPEMSYCTVHIVATEEVARVVFDNTNFLGVEVKDYVTGDLINVPDGERDIVIYNGAEKGQLTFLISFSGAVSSLTSVAAAVAAVTLLGLF